MKQQTKKSKLQRMVTVFLVFAMVFALCACSKGGGNEGVKTSGPADGNPDGGESSQGNEFVANPDVKAESAQREVINVGVQSDITDWGPWASGDTGRNDALWGIYQPLIDFDGGEYIPVLLKWYEIAEDGLTMDCELWDNIYDSEGNHMTAEDIKYSYEQKIVQGQVQFQEVLKEVQVTGDYTVTFVLNRPLQVGEIKDTFTTPMITRASYEAGGDDMHTKPVGTGPYVLASQTSGYMFTYTKNENYWATGEQILQTRDMANVDTINYYVISESSQRTIALQTGDIDVCGSVSAEDLDKFDNQNGYKLYSYPDNLSMILFPNCDESSVCSDVNLRRAICYAVDSKAVLDVVYKGNGKVMYSQVPDWAVGYNKAWESEDNYYQYDLAKAKEYLEKSSYSGETLHIICAADTASTDTATLLNNFLTQLGVKSTIDSYESSVFKDYIKLADKWDILLKTQPTSSGFYAQTLNSDFVRTRFTWDGTINFVFDDELQDMITTVMTEMTSTQDNIDALQQRIVDNCYSMGLVNYNSFVVVPDYLSELCLSYRKTIIPGGCIYAE